MKKCSQPLAGNEWIYPTREFPPWHCSTEQGHASLPDASSNCGSTQRPRPGGTDTDKLTLTDKLSFSEGICLRPWLSYIGVSKSWSPNHWTMLAKFVVRVVPEECQPCDPPNTWNNEVVVYPSRRGRDSQEWPWWTWFTDWGLIISSLSST